MSKFQCSCAIASLSVISMMSAHATSFSLVWLKTANMAVANEQQWALETVNKLLLWPEVEGNRLSDCLFHFLQSDLQLCWSDRMLLFKAKTRRSLTLFNFGGNVSVPPEQSSTCLCNLVCIL